MRKLINIALVLLLLTACSKVKSAEKKINGEWTLTSMKYYDLEGVLHLPECSGTMKVVQDNSAAMQYEMHIEFNFADSLFSELSTGTLNLTEKASSLELSINTADTSYVQKQTILLLTKSDLRVEFFAPNGYKRVYTFLKN